MFSKKINVAVSLRVINLRLRVGGLDIPLDISLIISSSSHCFGDDERGLSRQRFEVVDG